MKSQLQVYARLKPWYIQGELSLNCLNLDTTKGIDNWVKVEQSGIREQYEGDITYSVLGFQQFFYQETLEFNFADILDSSASQDQTFNQVAVPVVLNCLDGYNGTIFAYGQTGSGKTYTINGSDSWAYRGIIPRVMTYIFDKIDERKNEYHYTVYASYMEIYNEKAFDLLNEDHLVSPIEQWNKIEFKRDHQGNIHLNNISLHEIDDAKPGIDLLMMGNYIRKQAATPMNQCSSRSHCIFTLTFEARLLENDTCFVSKLNLVDLAGSERVSKTNHDGVLLNEAKNINLSLSYLEQVIVALNEKKKTGLRQHIPYRHSILTTILKDSLGGNCKTVMIANVSTDMDNFEETISALRFSQRVGQLENEIHRNQKIDLSAQVQKLEIEKQMLLGELQKYQKIVGDMDSQSKEQEANKQFKKQLNSQQFHQRHQSNIDDEELYDEAEDAEDADLDQILTKVDEYMTEKTDQLDAKNMVEAKLCFRAMKEYHKSTMADYLRELSDISKKLQQYDALLPSKKPSEVQSQARDSEITQMALNNFYNNNNSQKNSMRSSAAGQDENAVPIYSPAYYQNINQAISYQNANISDDLNFQPSSQQEFTKKSKMQQNQQQQQQQQQIQSDQQDMPSSYMKNEGIEVNLYKYQKKMQQPLTRSKNENAINPQQMIQPNKYPQQN